MCGPNTVDTFYTFLSVIFATQGLKMTLKQMPRHVESILPGAEVAQVTLNGKDPQPTFAGHLRDFRKKIRLFFPSEFRYFAKPIIMILDCH